MTGPLVLLHEDGDVVAVDKPFGVAVIPARGEDEQACLQKRLERQSRPAAVGRAPHRPRRLRGRALRSERGGSPRAQPRVREPAGAQELRGVRGRPAVAPRRPARRGAARGAQGEDATGRDRRAGGTGGGHGVRDGPHVAARRRGRVARPRESPHRAPPPGPRPPALRRRADPLRPALRPRPRARVPRAKPPLRGSRCTPHASTCPRPPARDGSSSSAPWPQTSPRSSSGSASATRRRAREPAGPASGVGSAS